MALPNGLSNKTHTIAEYYQTPKLGSIEKKKMFKSKTFFVRFILVLILISLFTWWGGRAVNRPVLLVRLKIKGHSFFSYLLLHI